MTFSDVIKRLITDLSINIHVEELGIKKRTVQKLREGGSSAKHEYNAGALWGGFRGLYLKRCKSSGKAPEEFRFPFEVLGDPREGKPIDETKRRLFFELAKRQFLESAASDSQSNGEEDSGPSDIEGGLDSNRPHNVGGTQPSPRTVPSPVRNTPTVPHLSLGINLSGYGFLCVRTPASANLLREQGLLPLRHDAVAQLHVNFEQPQHFCLFAFGPDQKVHAYVPHPNLPAGQPRDRLTVPGDLIPGMAEIPFAGAGGAESFILLVADHPIEKSLAETAQKTIARIVRRAGSIRLPNAAPVYVKDEVLSATKALPLSAARPLSDPLERILADVRCELAGHFVGFHLLCVHRQDPPHHRKA